MRAEKKTIFSGKKEFEIYGIFLYCRKRINESNIISGSLPDGNSYPPIIGKSFDIIKRFEEKFGYFSIRIYLSPD